ncbi:hypothetical protein GYH30_029599, partial [Glycine max]
SDYFWSYATKCDDDDYGCKEGTWLCFKKTPFSESLSKCKLAPYSPFSSSYLRIFRYNVALSNFCIGDSCVIHNGVCIGQDGFGFYVDGDGNMIKKPQMLNVIIGNNVEIGACIDRGSWRDTVIGDNSKIDNLVQHRRLCDYGRKGSSTRSFIHHIKASCVTKDIKEPGDYGGFPAVLIHQWRIQVASRCQTLG